MLKRAILGILALFAVGTTSAPLVAQSVLHGVVRDAASTMPVADARISVLDSLGRAPVTVASDARGRFAARLPSAGLYTVAVARIGYFPDTLQSVRVILERRLDITLRPGAVVLPPIEVASRPPAGELAPPVLHRTRNRIKLVPAAAGIEDPVRALGLEPGVALANPYSARLTLRGSAPSELGFFVDGFPILNPAQLGGTFSAIPASAVSGVTLWGTAAPFRLSGSSGGVVDVSTSPTLGRGFEADAGLNVLASDAALRFSSDDRAAITTAARYSWFPATLEDRSERDEFSLTDYLLSASVAPSRRARVFGLAFRSAESRGDADFGTGTQRRVGNYHRWGRTLGAGIELSLGDRSSVTARAWDARARAGGQRLELANLEAVDSSTLRNQGALVEATSVAGKVQWTIGARVADLSASTDARFTTFIGELDAGALRTGTTRTVTSVHVASGWQLDAGTLLDAGAAVVLDGGRVELAPTLAARVQLSPVMQVFASASSKTQHLFQLTDPRSRPWASFSVVDVWAVAGDGADVGDQPARTTEFTAGAHWSTSSVLRLGGQAWVRQSRNLRVLDVAGPVAQGAARLTSARGSSVGLGAEAELALPFAMTARAGYTWSRARLAADGERYPGDFDTPHRLVFLLARQPASGFQFSIAGSLQSGQVYTEPSWGYLISDWNPVSGYDPNPNPLAQSGALLYGTPNQARTPTTHRVDVQVGFIAHGGAVTVELFAAALNVTQGQSIPPRINVAGGQGGRINRTPAYSLPPVPLIGVRLRL